MPEVDPDENEKELEIPSNANKQTFSIIWYVVVVWLLMAGTVGFTLGRNYNKQPPPTVATMGPMYITSVVPDFTEMAAPADHPPTVVSVEGGDFTFHYTPRSELLQLHCTGETKIEKREVWLPADADGREIRETVLHEVMHIALVKAGGQLNTIWNSGDGESIINPSAIMLLNIMRGNPALVKWITRAQPKGKT